MTQKIKALAALLEDLGLIPRTYMPEQDLLCLITWYLTLDACTSGQANTDTL